MINQSQAIPAEPTADSHQATALSVADEQQQRAGTYALLGRLLRSAPDAALLQQLSQLRELQQERSDLGLAMSMLGLSASSSTPDATDTEYHRLFIGIGRGELVPYGSWYLTGFLMEKPLGRLRDDLERLGFERDESVHEPEDHIAALCEVMSMLISDGSGLDCQRDFFNNHMGDWVGRFYQDLEQANSAVFYKAVGRFGFAFSEFEKTYFSMSV